MLLTLSQISGSLYCLKVLMRRGVLVPQVELERLAADKAKWEAQLDAMEVTDLGPSNLNMLP